MCVRHLGDEGDVRVVMEAEWDDLKVGRSEELSNGRGDSSPVCRGMYVGKGMPNSSASN